jgi:hypothetical protein
MVVFPEKTIYLYNHEVDFRKGIASLTSLIYTSFPLTDHKNSLFIFFSRNARQVKIIEIENKSVWLYQNRLEDHRFIFPKADKDIRITASQLSLILQTVEPLKRTNRSK